MKFIITSVGSGVAAFPLGNLTELARAKEALRSARQKTAQVYRGNPNDPTTWRREGRLTAAPSKKPNAARRPDRSGGRKAAKRKRNTAHDPMLRGYMDAEARRRGVASEVDADELVAAVDTTWGEALHPEFRMAIGGKRAFESVTSAVRPIFEKVALRYKRQYGAGSFSAATKDLAAERFAAQYIAGGSALDR